MPLLALGWVTSIAKRWALAKSGLKLSKGILGCTFLHPGLYGKMPPNARDQDTDSLPELESQEESDVTSDFSSDAEADGDITWVPSWRPGPQNAQASGRGLSQQLETLHGRHVGCFQQRSIDWIQREADMCLRFVGTRKAAVQAHSKAHLLPGPQVCSAA